MKTKPYCRWLGMMLLVVGGFCGCESYSTPDLDEQKRLNEQWQQGKISKKEYDEALSRQRDRPWGTTGEAPPRTYHAGF